MSDVQVNFARVVVSFALATYAADQQPGHELTCLHFCQMAPSVSFVYTQISRIRFNLLVSER